MNRRLMRYPSGEVTCSTTRVSKHDIARMEKLRAAYLLLA